MFLLIKHSGSSLRKKMTWDEHINHIKAKLSRIVGLTFIYKAILPTEVKKILYNSLFYSHINYCHLVWGNTTIANLQRIHALQKKILRNISNVSFDHPSAELFLKHNIMTIYNLYSYRLALIYKKELKQQRNFLTQLSSLTVKINPYLTRTNEIWKIDVCRTNYGTQMLKHKLPELLNFCHTNTIVIERTTNKELRAFFNLQTK